MTKVMRNTGVIGMITIPDSSREEGFRLVDVGNIFLDDEGGENLLTTDAQARKYHQYITAQYPALTIYTKKGK